jgi:outer membrane autotransporter protein
MLSVGAGNTINNAGTIVPGGTGSIETTTLTGKLSQSSTGALAIDLDAAANAADRINVTETALLSGSIKLTVDAISISSGTVTVLSAAGGTSIAGLSLSPAPVALQAELLYPNAHDVQISYDLSFAPTSIGLSGNQTSLGNHIDDAVIADPTKLTGITQALFSLTDANEYRAALDQLSPEIYGDGAAANLYGAHTFGNALLSCHKRDAQYAAVSEDECMWVSISGRTFDQDASAKGIGYDEQTWGVSGGGQVSVAPNYVLGIAGGFEQGNADATSGASAETDRAYAGVTLKHNVGPWIVAGAVFGGTGSTDVTRQINFGGLATTATGDQTISHLSGRLRVAYQAGGNALYVKPLIDLDATQLWLGSVQEQGGVGALNIASSGETIFSAAPAVEIGGETKLEGGTLVRPFARVGGVFYSEDSIALSSAFLGGPAGIANFETLAQVEQAMANVGAGLDMLWADGTAIRAQYDGLFGGDTQQHSFGAKASVRF